VVEDSGRVVGVVLAADVMERYSHELRKLRLASTIASRRTFSVETDGMELGHGMRLAEVEVPPSLENQTLREAELRARFGIEVLYLLKGPYSIRKLAAPELVLEAGDRMVILTEASSLQGFRERTAARVTPSSLRP
jgi:Trk K+ transport system NAD-binding subunit